MRFNRRRSDRPDSARSRLGSSLETLEKRELLTDQQRPTILSVYTPADLAVYNPITNQPVDVLGQPPAPAATRASTTRSSATRARSSRARTARATSGRSPSTGRAT